MPSTDLLIMRHRVKRRTMGKELRQMSKSLLDDNVTGEVSIVSIIEPTQPTSSLGTGHIFEGADTEDICSPNSIVKYINIRFESGLRDVAPSAPGFVEYGIVVQDEQAGLPTVPGDVTSSIGATPLGTILRNKFRGKCIWNGSFAVSRELPRVVDIALKMPNVYCKNKRGRFVMLYKSFRTNDVSDTTTDCRSWLSFQFNCYI